MVLHSRGDTQRPADWMLARGRWWPDGWITPVLEVGLRDVPPNATLLVTVYGPGVAPRQIENAITLECAGAILVQQLPWEGVVELNLSLPRSVSRDVTLTIRVHEPLEPDELDRRERGVIISQIMVCSDDKPSEV